MADNLSARQLQNANLPSQVAAVLEETGMPAHLLCLEITEGMLMENHERSVEILKQPQYDPVSMERQAAILYAVTNGHLDEVPLPAVPRWETEFHRFMDAAHPEVGRKIAETNDMDAEAEEALRSAIEEFKRTFRAEE